MKHWTFEVRKWLISRFDIVRLKAFCQNGDRGEMYQNFLELLDISRWEIDVFIGASIKEDFLKLIDGLPDDLSADEYLYNI